MWEFEIIGSRINSTYIAFLQEFLRQALAKDGAVSAITGDAEKVVLTIGCNKENKTAIKAKLRLGIAELICEKIKFDFLYANLDLFFDQNRFVLAKICTYFDSDLDKQIVMQYIDLNAKKLNIESFFAFRLGVLKNKWKELCNITNNNAKNISKTNNFYELVRFLLSNIENKSQSVILEMNESCLIYHDIKKDFDMMVNIDFTDKLFVLGKIIELNPMLIKIYPDKENAETITLIKNIFMDRVVLG